MSTAAALPWASSPRTLLILAIALLVVAVVFGGGGSPAPVAETAVELASLALFAVATWAGLRPVELARIDRPLAVLVATITLFPLLQLVPLPPAWWHALPGRAGAQAALATLGADGGWRPWSLLPDAGWAATLALLPPLTILLLAAGLPPAARVRLVAGVVAAGLVAAVLGMVQFARGEAQPLNLYAEFHRGWGTGFFANRNAQADLLTVALTGGLLLIERYRAALTGPVALASAAAGLLMTLGVIVTGSRMGMTMLIVPALLAIRFAGRRGPLVIVLVAAGTLAVLAGGTALDRVAARAGDAGNRADIWGDSLFVARAVAPVGGGMGSFQPLYATAERLDHVQPTIANRAHNDYLELAIEGGVPALLLLAGTLVFVARRCRRDWRHVDPDRRLLVRFAGLTATILAVHSAVDYPLRSLTLLTIAGLALAGLGRERGRDEVQTGAHA